ncbi:MAG TPA: DUF58 domain-containing protein, partial [Flavisolibacter sp.]|nr:DUF58 domain-containing protein [Flavisolibacter sp.]
MFRTLIHFWDLTSFYLHKKVYYTGYGIAVLFVLSFFLPALQSIAFFLLLAIFMLVLIDTVLLYQKKGIAAKRILPERLSNGDDNKVVLEMQNDYNYRVSCAVIDELPQQFQERGWIREVTVDGQSPTQIIYHLKPKERGEYLFGRINVYATGPLQTVRRRFILGEEQTVKVYPSYVQMRRYQLLAVGNKLSETGSRRMRKLGHSMEFEQIKDYVQGDDYCTINWKATARRGDLMVNNYTDEKSQQIY